MAAQLVATNARPFVVPALIAGAGDRAALRFLEYFTVNSRNKNTCEERGLMRSGSFSLCTLPRILRCCGASARLPRSSDIWPVFGCCSTGW